MTKQTQIQERQQDVFGEMPRTLEGALRLAEILAKSSVVPKNYIGKPGNILVAMQFGAEVGLKPMQALQGVAVINGVPSLWGGARLGVVLDHPSCIDVIETLTGTGDNMIATCICKRKDKEDVVRSFSVADAKKAGLWNKPGVWQNYPKRMLGHRARGFAIEDQFADVLKGLKDAEEVMDYKDMGEADVIREVKIRKPIKEVSKENIIEAEVVVEDSAVSPVVDSSTDTTDIINKLCLAQSPEEMYPIYEKGAQEAGDANQLKLIYEAAASKARQFIANKQVNPGEILQYVATIKDDAKKKFIKSKAEAIKESLEG